VISDINRAAAIDIHGGSQDLCKISLDFMPVPIYYTDRTYIIRSRFQVQVFGL